MLRKKLQVLCNIYCDLLNLYTNVYWVCISVLHIQKVVSKAKIPVQDQARLLWDQHHRNYYQDCIRVFKTKHIAKFKALGLRITAL